MGFDKLELSTETLCELTQHELTQVAGGIKDLQLTQSPACPSGATWFAQCYPPVLGSLNCG